jgi:phosphatidylserine decarboxylase
MSIGHHPSQEQYAPDMRKKDEDISESERVEAKRRIEGSISGPAVKPTVASMAG